MEVQAQARWVRTAPRKVRLVAATLKGLPVADALTACKFMPKAAARDVAKVIRSAQANAEHNFNLAKDDLVLKDIVVEAGPIIERGQPRAMGRYFSIFKRTSHITAVVEDRPGMVRRRPRPAARAAQASTRATPVPPTPPTRPRPAATAAPAASARPPKKEARRGARDTAEPAAQAEKPDARKGLKKGS